MPDKEKPIRLISPYFGHEDLKGVYVYLSSQDHDYLFRHLLAGERAGTAIGAQFFKALIDHLKSISIPAVYDPDNQFIIARALSHINFREPEPTPDTGATTSRRRADRSAPKPPRKPAVSKRNGGASPRSRSKVQDVSGDTD